MSIRRLIKRVVFAAAFVLASPAILIALLEKRTTKGEALFVAGSQLLALIPGRVGVYMRAAYYFATLDGCSWEIHVGFGSIFTHRAAVLERNASMGAYCVIGHARIGEGVMMASRVSIPSGKRQHLDGEGRVTSQARFDVVTIGAGTWVGEGAIIMADVGARCIVSAGAVLPKTTPPAVLVGGNPAEVLKRLDEPRRSTVPAE